PPGPSVFQRCLPDLSTHNGTTTVANRTQGITGLLDTREMGLKIMEDYAKSWFWILIAVGQITSSLFYPVVTFILLTICISYWALTALYPSLTSSGEAVYRVMSPDQSCPHANSTCTPQVMVHSAPSCMGSQCLFAFYGGETLLHRHLPRLQLFNLLVLLWLLNFSLALQRCTLAGAFSSYYWAQRKPQDVPPCPLYSSFTRTLRYHTGTLAFGSLLLSVVQLLRIILEYLQAKLTGLDNPVSRFILCCLRCCFWCLDRFLRYMNNNTYIMVRREIISITYTQAAVQSFSLWMVDRLTDVLLFLGKVLIAAAVGKMTVALGSYLIAHGFFSVYAMCVDTLFLCFCDDLERNDGSPERPYFMSPELHRILGKPKPWH
uniref:Choline transporter-like protein n=1 Tax=Neogobius melanostomus TaxID=47308 RepID=A0A8C6TRS9_9GOBI